MADIVSCMRDMLDLTVIKRSCYPSRFSTFGGLMALADAANQNYNRANVEAGGMPSSSHSAAACQVVILALREARPIDLENAELWVIPFIVVFRADKYRACESANLEYTMRMFSNPDA